MATDQNISQEAAANRPRDLLLRLNREIGMRRNRPQAANAPAKPQGHFRGAQGDGDGVTQPRCQLTIARPFCRIKHLPLAAVEAIACKHFLRRPLGHLRKDRSPAG